MGGVIDNYTTRCVCAKLRKYFFNRKLFIFTNVKIIVCCIRQNEDITISFLSKDMIVVE